MLNPAPLFDLLRSLHLIVDPIQAAPGDRVHVRVVPDLSPVHGDDVNALLRSLTIPETIAEIDLRPILTYLAETLTLDAWGVLKAVEFDPPVAQQASLLNVDEQPARGLKHFVAPGAPIPVGQQILPFKPLAPLGSQLPPVEIPVPGSQLPGLEVPVAPVISELVAGLVEKARAKLTFDPDKVRVDGETAEERARAAEEKAKAIIRKPAVFAEVPVVTLNFRVEREATRTPGVAGQDFVKSASPWIPDFVFLPVAVATPQPPIRWNFYCDVEASYTLIDGTRGNFKWPLGPIPFFLETTLVPVVAIVTEDVDPAAPGRVFVAVPEDSPAGDVGTALSSLDQLLGVLSTITNLVGFAGIPVPLSDAVKLLHAVRNAPVHFGKGTHVGFWVLFQYDWQRIMSGFYVFGTRRALLWSILYPGVDIGVYLSPGPIGVGAIPNLDPYPLQPTAGTAQPVLPAWITPANGILDDINQILSFT